MPCFLYHQHKADPDRYNHTTSSQYIKRNLKASNYVTTPPHRRLTLTTLAPTSLRELNCGSSHGFHTRITRQILSPRMLYDLDAKALVWRVYTSRVAIREKFFCLVATEKLKLFEVAHSAAWTVSRLYLIDRRTRNLDRGWYWIGEALCKGFQGRGGRAWSESEFVDENRELG
jgi:hypothetical protein